MKTKHYLFAAILILVMGFLINYNGNLMTGKYSKDVDDQITGGFSKEVTGTVIGSCYKCNDGDDGQNQYVYSDGCDETGIKEDKTMYLEITYTVYGWLVTGWKEIDSCKKDEWVYGEAGPYMSKCGVSEVYCDVDEVLQEKIIECDEHAKDGRCYGDSNLDCGEGMTLLDEQDWGYYCYRDCDDPDAGPEDYLTKTNVAGFMYGDSNFLQAAPDFCMDIGKTLKERYCSSDPEVSGPYIEGKSYLTSDPQYQDYICVDGALVGKKKECESCGATSRCDKAECYSLGDNCAFIDNKWWDTCATVTCSNYHDDKAGCIQYNEKHQSIAQSCKGFDETDCNSNVVCIWDNSLTAGYKCRARDFCVYTNGHCCGDQEEWNPTGGVCEPRTAALCNPPFWPNNKDNADYSSGNVCWDVGSKGFGYWIGIVPY